jgi:hypothetical protein
MILSHHCGAPVLKVLALTTHFNLLFVCKNALSVDGTAICRDGSARRIPFGLRGGPTILASARLRAK